MFFERFARLELVQEEQGNPGLEQAWIRQLCCCDTFHLVLLIPAESSRIILSDQTSEEIPPSHRV